VSGVIGGKGERERERMFALSGEGEGEGDLLAQSVVICVGKSLLSPCPCEFMSARAIGMLEQLDVRETQSLSFKCKEITAMGVCAQ